MYEEKIYEYFAFGFNYSNFKEGLLGANIHGDEDSLLGTIEQFFKDLQHLNLQVTQMAASDLRDIQDSIKNLPEDTKVDAITASKVKNALVKLDATLDAELQLKSAYVVTSKRFPLEYLLITPSALFATNVFNKLPELSKYDFSEACKCVAFNLPTAAAFHLMRGTEGVLRFYYSSIIKRNKLKRLMWGDIVNDLRKRRNPPSKTLLDSLDNIRVNFRNPTQHPEAKYDLDEVQDLLSLSIEVTNRLIRDLNVDVVKKNG